MEQSESSLFGIIEPFISKSKNLDDDCSKEYRGSSINQHATLSLFFPTDAGIQTFSFDRPFVDKRLEPRPLANGFSCSNDDSQDTSALLDGALLDATHPSPSFEAHRKLCSLPQPSSIASAKTPCGTRGNRDTTRNDFSNLSQSKRCELSHKNAREVQLEPWPLANDSPCSDDEFREISAFLDGALLDATAASPSFEAHSKLRGSPEATHLTPTHSQSGMSSIRVAKINQLSNLPQTKRRKLSNNSPSEEQHSQFNEHHDSLWREQFQKLIAFKECSGHCFVPVQYSENRQLARWVKRQRHEYKMFQDGKTSATDSNRIQSLESIGFVWDAHASRWHEKWEELVAYKKRQGHCNMPSHDSEYPQLSSWVKSQRRQYKLFQSNMPSNMTSARMDALNSIGFSWTSQQQQKASKLKR
eukprot:scaffold2744_cov136-Cylindrotheca_fusiformis.AAC.7